MATKTPIENYVPAAKLSRGVITKLPVTLASSAVAAVPSAAAYVGSIIYVTNGAAGAPVVAFSNGTNWLRVDTLANISAV